MGLESGHLITVVIILSLASRIDAERHTVYWDESIMPGLKKELKLDVAVNDWMDILCPHKASYNRTSMDSSSLYLELYNVSFQHYKHCSVRGQKRLLHCRDPRQEIKLTTKFQTKSPSPIGFVFLPGHAYYYISKPTQKVEHGCTSDTLRMTIRVSDKRSGSSFKNGGRKKPPGNHEKDKGETSVWRQHNHPKAKTPDKTSEVFAKKFSEPQASREIVPPSVNTKPGNSALSALKRQWQLIYAVLNLFALFIELLFVNKVVA